MVGRALTQEEKLVLREVFKQFFNHTHKKQEWWQQKATELYNNLQYALVRNEEFLQEVES